MSNLHVDLDELNKHDPKGFIPAVNNTFPVKDELGNSFYEERMSLPKAINFVDGTVAAPTTVDGDIYVLTGSGVVDSSWGGAAFGDWVRFLNTFATPITPLDGYLCFDETAATWMQYDGSVWAVFGGGGGGATEVGTGVNSLQQVGVGASANDVKTIALGFAATASNTSAIAFGRDTSANTVNSIAIGPDASVIGTGGMALGDGASATNNQTISIGTDALTHNQFSMAIGNTANCGGINAMAIGRLASSQGLRSLAIGHNMGATQTNAYMIGGALTAKTNSTANSMEVNFDEATSTVRFGQSVDSWINTSANFGIGLNTGLAAKVHIKGAGITSGTTALLVQNNSGLDLLRTKDDGTISAANLSTYASDFAAGVGGLVANDIYKTSTGELRIKI